MKKERKDKVFGMRCTENEKMLLENVKKKHKENFYHFIMLSITHYAKSKKYKLMDEQLKRHAESIHFYHTAQILQKVGNYHRERILALERFDKEIVYYQKHDIKELYRIANYTLLSHHQDKKFIKEIKILIKLRVPHRYATIIKKYHRDIKEQKERKKRTIEVYPDEFGSLQREVNELFSP